MALGKGFTKATSETIEALIISICGEEGQGKTHFSLTAPGGIAIFNTDIGLRGVVEKFADDKDVYPFSVALPSPREPTPVELKANSNITTGIILSQDARMEWDRFIQGVREALEDDSIRTVICDTATELWELLRLAHFGKLTEVQSWHYGPCNAEYRNFIKMFYDKEDNPIKNLILIHKMKTVYVANKATDRREYSGFSGTGHLVQINATMTKDTPWEDEDGNWNTGDYNLQFNLRKGCRLNPDLDGTYLVGPDCNFAIMAMSALPTSDADNWL